MGVIRKQTVSGTIFSYAGVVLGFVNLAVLSPLIFTAEQIGLPSLLIAISVIASQIGSLGFNNVTIRLFPFFRNKQNQHNGFLGMAMVVQTIGLALVLLSMIFFIPYLENRNQDDLSILRTFSFLLIPLIIAQHFSTLFDAYCRALFNAAIGIILREFVVRVLNLVIIGMYYFKWIDFNTFMYLYVISYGIPAIVLMIYLISRKEFSFRLDFSFITPAFRKEIIGVSLFGIAAGLSGQAVLNIDKYMINDFLTLSSVGIYTIAFSFGTLILIPGRAMSKIAAPVLAEMWKENSRDSIIDVYRKSSVNQFLGGVVIFLLIWLNIDDVMSLLPDKYSGGKAVILFISLANLMTVISGVSLQILSTSKHYRYHTYFMVMLVVLVIISNLIFIPIWGISGAALASFIATSLYVLIRVVFLQIRERMQPFNFRHLTSLLAGAITYIAISLIPLSFGHFFNIAIRSAITAVLIFGLVFFLKCSPEFNELVKSLFSRFFPGARK